MSEQRQKALQLLDLMIELLEGDDPNHFDIGEVVSMPTSGGEELGLPIHWCSSVHCCVGLLILQDDALELLDLDPLPTRPKFHGDQHYLHYKTLLFRAFESVMHLLDTKLDTPPWVSAALQGGNEHTCDGTEDGELPINEDTDEYLEPGEVDWCEVFSWTTPQKAAANLRRWRNEL